MAEKEVQPYHTHRGREEVEARGVWLSVLRVSDLSEWPPLVLPDLSSIKL